MKNVYFKDLDSKLKNLFTGLDYKSKKYPLELSDNKPVCFKGNRSCKYMFNLLDDLQIDDLWVQFYNEHWPLEDIMEFYRICGYSIQGFLEIFQPMYAKVLDE
jgi:hypothetical protein